MLRADLGEALKQALKTRDACTLATVRLILAALKDRDIAARTRGRTDGVDEAEILALLQTMVKQRRESIRLYEEGGRRELAAREREEIAVIERFMPNQMEGEELAATVRAVIAELGARNMKDMGRTMAALKQRYPGRLDFTRASEIVRRALA